MRYICPMKVDYLLIGQGISGTWLSYFLQKENKSFLVMDDKNPNAPSRLAAGIINPVTGRRHVSTWMIDTLLPYIWEQYSTLGNDLGITAISQRNVLDFFPVPRCGKALSNAWKKKGNMFPYPTTPISFCRTSIMNLVVEKSNRFIPPISKASSLPGERSW